MAALPTLEALAAADPELIHKLWEGLGYYTRVRNLQKAAQQIVREHAGQFPSDFAAVLDLPGIGRYTAGAICSIAFGQPTPILDGNVIRVLTRTFGIEGDPRDKTVNTLLWRRAGELVAQAAGGQAGTRSACGDLNESLMELGALICTPREPQCPLCPVNRFCRARRENRTAELPTRVPRAGATERRFVAFVAECRGKYLVRQRAPGTVNGHLWEFPNVEAFDRPAHKALQGLFGIGALALEPLITIRHSITRYRITLEAFRLTGRKTGFVAAKDGRWVSREELQQLPFPSAHRKIAMALLTRERGSS